MKGCVYYAKRKRDYQMKKIIKKLKGSVFHTFLLLFLLLYHFSNKNYIINYPLVLYFIPLTFLLATVAYRLKNGVSIGSQIQSNSFIFPVSMGVLFIIIFFEVPGNIAMSRYGPKEIITFEIENSFKRKGGSMSLHIYNDSIQERITLRKDSSVLEHPENYEIEALCYKHYLNAYFVDDYVLLDISLIDNIKPPKDSSRYIFTGEIMRNVDGAHVSHGHSVILEVYQNGSRTIDTLDGRNFSVELSKSQEATLIFTSEGYKTKKLHLTKVPFNTSDIFNANCVFEKGEGTTEKRMSLDSLATADLGH